MKRLIILLSLLAFVGAAPLAVAASKTDSKINCCIEGKCEKLTKKACKEAKGKVVSSCKKCKPPKR